MNQTFFNVGDRVLDDLTGHYSIILRPLSDGDGHISGYLIDNPYLDGYRYSWEVSEITLPPDSEEPNQ